MGNRLIRVLHVPFSKITLLWEVYYKNTSYCYSKIIINGFISEHIARPEWFNLIPCAHGNFFMTYCIWASYCSKSTFPKTLNRDYFISDFCLTHYCRPVVWSYTNRSTVTLSLELFLAATCTANNTNVFHFTCYCCLQIFIVMPMTC